MIRMIIIAKDFRTATNWLFEARLQSNSPSQSYVIIKDKQDCEKLLSCRLEHDIIIARVGEHFKDTNYILDFLKTLVRK